MDLSAKAIHNVIHPTAVFSKEFNGLGSPPASGRGTNLTDAASTHHENYDIDGSNDKDHDNGVVCLPPSWAVSHLNPKNRIESLDHPKNPQWRIDGCTSLGTQFFAIPIFMHTAPPMRIDVFIPEQAKQTPKMRRLLNLATAFHVRDGTRVSKLGIASYIIRALQLWSASFADFTGTYKSLPFGSHIVFENLPTDIRDIRIRIAHGYHLELQMLSVPALCNLWHIPGGSALTFFPELTDLSKLHVLKQVHDSTSIVLCKGKQVIFKAVTSYTKYVYHELYNLLSIAPHPNIIARPKHIVTKKCSFGSKTAVLGFTLEFHPQGSMRDNLPVRRFNGHLTLSDQFRWAKQITSALLHLRETGGPFYSDLRLDNIVLSDSDDAILVDFEQRGVWCEFGPPEVNALEYVRLLAEHEDSFGSSDQTDSGSERDMEYVFGDHDKGEDEDSMHDSRRYARLLSRLLPGYESLLAWQNYSERGFEMGGYNVSWLCLTPPEREAAEVYMLGRVIYCIFEGVSAPARASVWQSYRSESDVEFPNYVRTPDGIAALIDKCTGGRRPTLTNLLSRVGDRITIMDKHQEQEGGVENVQRIARRFWKDEVQQAVGFLEDRLAAMKNGSWNENYFERPTLAEVLTELNNLSVALGVYHGPERLGSDGQ